MRGSALIIFRLPAFLFPIRLHGLRCYTGWKTYLFKTQYCCTMFANSKTDCHLAVLRAEIIYKFLALRVIKWPWVYIYEMVSMISLRIFLGLHVAAVLTKCIKYLVSNTQLSVWAQTWMARLGYTHDSTSACLISLVQRSVWNNVKCFCVQWSTISERGFVSLNSPRFRLPLILQSISFSAVPSTAVWSLTDLASARTSGIIGTEI